MTASRSEILRGHNQHHNPNYVRSSGLDASAQIVAHRLGRKDKGIAHAAKWWRIIDKMTKKRYGTEGENLALDYDSANALMTAWMNSPLHKKNIVNPRFKYIGIGVALGRRTGRSYYVVHFGG